MENQKIKALAEKLTDAVFCFNPYLGADADELTAQSVIDLQSLSACHEIIDQLCDMLLEC